MAWNLFISAVNSVFQNLGTAIKVSLVPFVLMIAVIAGGIFVISETNVFVPGSGLGVGAGVLMGLVLVVVCLAIFVWIAVLWHRAIILNESVGFFPRMRGLPLGPYLGRTIVLGLIMIAIMIPIGFVFAFIGSIFGIATINSGVVGLTITGTILNLVFGTLLLFIWLRFASVLPGIALGEPFQVQQGWRGTDDISGEIFKVAFFATLMNLVFGFVTLIAGSVGVFAAAGVEVFTSWLSIMIGLSVLTKVYEYAFHKDTSADVFA